MIHQAVQLLTKFPCASGALPLATIYVLLLLGVPRQVESGNPNPQVPPRKRGLTERNDETTGVRSCHTHRVSYYSGISIDHHGNSAGNVAGRRRNPWPRSQQRQATSRRLRPLLRRRSFPELTCESGCGKWEDLEFWIDMTRGLV